MNEHSSVPYYQDYTLSELRYEWNTKHPGDDLKRELIRLELDRRHVPPYIFERFGEGKKREENRHE